MTNRDYIHKQHRGSSPAHQQDHQSPPGAPFNLPSEEWKNLTWYPVSSGPGSNRPDSEPRNQETPADIPQRH